MSDLELPKNLQRLRVDPGKHRLGLKVLAWGEAGGGKSFFAAHFPSPKLVLACGDLGISSYLPPEDTFLEVNNPNDLQEAIRFAVANQDKLASIVADPLTLAWEDWMDYWNEEFGGEIKGGQWKNVKAPWKMLMRIIMRSRQHACLTAWVDDVEYRQEEVAPNVRGKLEILKKMQPKVEKRVPHIFDLGILWSIDRDKLQQPTKWHRATVTKARRPLTVPPEELHVGKSWRFDETKPQNPWEAIVKPLLPHWSQGAVDWLGIDPREAEKDRQDLEQTAQDHTTGQLITLIREQKDLEKYRNVVWPEEIEPVIHELDKRHLATVMEAHERKKKELEG